MKLIGAVFDPLHTIWLLTALTDGVAKTVNIAAVEKLETQPPFTNLARYKYPFCVSSGVKVYVVE